jgi:DNA polymerase-3 subunit epsilon
VTLAQPLQVQTVPPDTLLTQRAQDVLATGPADARTLVATICQLPGVPALVAEHMALVLFAGRREFARCADGRWALAASAAAPATLALPTRDPLGELSYAVVDVETTGGSVLGGDRITEIAAVVVRGGEIADVFETLVNPERPIPPWITALTNITWDMVKDKPTFRDVCERVLGVLRGHVFVAHNATFDWRFLNAEVARATGERLAGRRLCTVRLARKVLPQLRSRSLDNVAAYYGVEIGARHRAGGDAVATARVLLRLLRDARGAHGIECWDDLERLLLARAVGRRRRRGRRGLPEPVRRDTTA